MNIKWSYYLIAGIYILLIALRGINALNETVYKKENSQYGKVFSIKKDFFTTVALICIIVTLAINCAAVIGGKSINSSTIIVTLLVIGFTILNSFTTIIFSENNKNVCFLGYTLVAGDIEKMQVKEGTHSNTLKITFYRDIESYNYTKVIIFGKNKDKLTEVFGQLVKNNEQ